ncbi:glycoside hydrolase family 2 TIM barrel-domain containing protein [Saccharicrinis fermentans]|uniref:Beta-galactosidase n=1 Tax=Saccharicrinis fermentans DSM 9555 = JCM 21142 TaxID=869213 RepID=W7Y3J2_9BACT|nr:glycoside hydrolase family 2 TIM barrel-domain containing protein [Saccharicrinis fermentans]GAF02138.1 beta-galactosidase [Saccharicrinis fermentans DSM 9555 = JCM 21142]
MRYTVLFMSLLLIMNLSAQENISFNSKWKFQLGDHKEVSDVQYDDANWRVLELPHDWSIEGEYSPDAPMGGQCGYLPAGIAWYRKTMHVPEEWKGKHVEIAFDGVFMNSTVYANGKKLGTRPYGWISFYYDISSIVNQSDEIIFAVRVDNEKQPSARWYTGSGIYANTWIRIRDHVHVPQDGIFVRTNKNVLTIDTEVRNKWNQDIRARLLTSVLDANGNEVASVEDKVRLQADTIHKIRQTITVNNPNLWNIDAPYLYTLVTRVKTGRKIRDRRETRFGIRDIEWKPETGMWLNGQNVKLQGVCNHQDAGALGAAVPDKILRYRIKQLKEMGVNAIRTAHNPQTPQFYAMCDEMGMLVMDEIFDGWMKKAANDYGAHAFKDWWKQDLRDWLKRDRNHPCVVIYSVGNETHGEVGEDLVQQCHLLDPTRPVTSGHSGSEYMDVLGVNGHSEKMGFFDELQDDRVFIGTENTHTWQVRGYYRTKTWYRDGYPNNRQKPYWYPDLTKEEVFSDDWTNAAGKSHFKQVFNSSYDNAMVRLTSRQNIEQLRDIPKYAGSFRWTGYDYIGEATYVHGGWPFKAFMGGAIDLANFEKDLFYLYQSQWTDKPMVHILPHWTHPTIQEGTKIPVWVYSNCDEVELFFNGQSLGRKPKGSKWNEMQREWLVAYQPGELKAVAFNQGKEVAQQTVRTAGPPSKISLSVDGEPLANEGKDIVQVRVTTTDANGEFYPYGENRTYFHVIGNGKIRALDNGSPIDVEKHFEASDRIAFYGLTRAYIESVAKNGDISLLATCILGEKKQVISKQVSIDTQMLTLRGKATKVDVKVYYTIDGSEPNFHSKLYQSPFEVELGTTVKALVVLNGKALYIMEERFAKDEGFVWDAVQQAVNPGGDQAEDATFNIAYKSTQGMGFKGTGYLDFGRNSGGYVEWYQENDGSAGAFTLKIRYSANKKIRPVYRVKLTVNGKSKEIRMPATDKFRTQWDTFETFAYFGVGANTIRLEALEDDGLGIDELRVE